MHRYADFVFDALKEDPAFFARFSFFVYAANPEVSALLASGDDAVIEDFGPVVEQYLDLIGRRVREPFTTELMLISINSMFQGLCLRHRTSPELVDRPIGPEGLGMYAHGLESIVMHFSHRRAGLIDQPAEGEHHGSARQIVTERCSQPVDFKGTVGLAAQGGVNYSLDNRWYANFDVRYLGVSLEATVTTAGGELEPVDLDIEPWVFGFGFGYRF